MFHILDLCLVNISGEREERKRFEVSTFHSSYMSSLTFYLSLIKSNINVGVQFPVAFCISVMVLLKFSCDFT